MSAAVSLALAEDTNALVLVGSNVAHVADFCTNTDVAGVRMYARSNSNVGVGFGVSNASATDAFMFFGALSNSASSIRPDLVLRDGALGVGTAEPAAGGMKFQVAGAAQVDSLKLTSATAPLVMPSAAPLIPFLNADLLDGRDGSYFTDLRNATAGPLPVAFGGTGVTTAAVGGLLYAKDATTLSTTTPSVAGFDDATVTLYACNVRSSNATVLNQLDAGVVRATRVGLGGLTPQFPTLDLISARAIKTPTTDELYARVGSVETFLNANFCNVNNALYVNRGTLYVAGNVSASGTVSTSQNLAGVTTTPLYTTDAVDALVAAFSNQLAAITTRQADYAETDANVISFIRNKPTDTSYNSVTAGTLYAATYCNLPATALINASAAAGGPGLLLPYASNLVVTGALTASSYKNLPAAAFGSNSAAGLYLTTANLAIGTTAPPKPTTLHVEGTLYATTYTNLPPSATALNIAGDGTASIPVLNVLHYIDVPNVGYCNLPAAALTAGPGSKGLTLPNGGALVVSGAVTAQGGYCNLPAAAFLANSAGLFLHPSCNLVIGASAAYPQKVRVEGDVWATAYCNLPTSATKLSIAADGSASIDALTVTGQLAVPQTGYRNLPATALQNAVGGGLSLPAPSNLSVGGSVTVGSNLTVNGSVTATGGYCNLPASEFARNAAGLFILKPLTLGGSAIYPSQTLHVDGGLWAATYSNLPPRPFAWSNAGESAVPFLSAADKFTTPARVVVDGGVETSSVAAASVSAQTLLASNATLAARDAYAAPAVQVFADLNAAQTAANSLAFSSVVESRDPSTNLAVTTWRSFSNDRLGYPYEAHRVVHVPLTTVNGRSGAVVIGTSDIVTPGVIDSVYSNIASNYNTVTAFNGRRGAVALTVADVGSVLDAGNASSAYSVVNTFNGRKGAVLLAPEDVNTDSISSSIHTKLQNSYGVVNTFNARTGDVTLSSADVTSALGFSPLQAVPNTAVAPGVYGSSSNYPQIVVDATGRVTFASNIPLVVSSSSSTTTIPNTDVAPGVYGSASNHPQISIDATGRVTFASNIPSVSTFNGRAGTVALTSGDVTTALTFTPTNASGTGVANYLPKFTGANALAKSSIVEDGSANVGIGTAAPSAKLHVVGDTITSNLSATRIVGGVFREDTAVASSGGVVFGSALATTVDFGQVDAHVLPVTGATYDIGSTSKPWRAMTANSVVLLPQLSDVSTLALPAGSVYMAGGSTREFNPLNSTDSNYPVYWNGSAWKSFAVIGNTGVAAGTYGSDTKVPVITVDASGRVTNASAATVAVPLTTVQKTGLFTNAGTSVATISSWTQPDNTTTDFEMRMWWNMGANNAPALQIALGSGTAALCNCSLVTYGPGATTAPVAFPSATTAFATNFNMMSNLATTAATAVANQPFYSVLNGVIQSFTTSTINVRAKSGGGSALLTLRYALTVRNATSSMTLS